MKEADDHCKGGVLFAEGLSFFGVPLSEDRRASILDKITVR